jgi:hypothetical protein
VDGRLIHQQVYTGTSMNLSGAEVLSSRSLYSED